MPQPPDEQDPRPDPDPETEGRTPPESLDPTEDAYAPEPGQFEDTSLTPAEEAPAAAPPPAPPPSPPAATRDDPAPGGGDDEEDEEDDGMLRMSFLDHLEELRNRILRALMGVGIAFVVCIFFADYLWDQVRQPAAQALIELGYPEDLAQITPTEAFSIIWVKIPVLAALFLASPWVVFQAWSFIAPGLYKRERRMALPFIFSTAGLFVLGGSFAYFVAFRFGLVFLLGIGGDKGVRPMISLTEYFDLFVNVILGIAIVFQLPVLIFFLTLLRIASPSFLIRNSRYAILLIVVAAAIITPTPDVMNLTLFAAPMILLYFVGVFASYLLVLSREGKKFPWGKVLFIVLSIALVFGVSAYMAISVYEMKWIWDWPFLVKK
jgi:sec-independent protein translocase protein TatC